MANLLELTSQGDVATISDESKLSQVVLMTPQQLYELWERQPWQTHTIDFTQDREDWAALPTRTRTTSSGSCRRSSSARSASRRSSAGWSAPTRARARRSS